MQRIVAPAEFRSQPWKNGGGVTHEIVRWPDNERYEVRVSLADDRVPGPFSQFPSQLAAVWREIDHGARAPARR